MSVRWTDPRSEGAGSWAVTPPRPGLRLTALGAVLVCLLMTLTFLAVLHLGRQAMCASHRTAAGHGALSYCPDYMPAPVR